MIRTDRIRTFAIERGFDLVGFAPARPARHAGAFRKWLDSGYAADMQWLGKKGEVRLDPRLVLEEVKTVVVVGLSYFVQEPPAALWNDPSRGRIARYAWGRDYHDEMLPMLNDLAKYIESEIGKPVAFRTYVDTGPVLERDIAEQAGLGFTGRNTMLINRQFGSYLFLGEILINEELELDSDAGKLGSEFGCGACARCLATCPTRAFPEPFVLDARKCISYLTIEHKGEIPTLLQSLMKNWIFGCDECQQVCPWVIKFSRPGRQRFIRFDADLCCPSLMDLIKLDEKEFRDRFAGTPVLRARYSGFRRNLTVAIKNWGDVEALSLLKDDGKFRRL